MSGSFRFGVLRGAEAFLGAEGRWGAAQLRQGGISATGAGRVRPRSEEGR